MMGFGALLVTLGGIVLAGELLLTWMKIAAAGGSLTWISGGTIVLGLFIVWRVSRATSQNAPAISLPNVAAPLATPDSVKSISVPKSDFPIFLHGIPIAYQYSDRGLAMADQLVSDFSRFVPGDVLTFAPEPNNAYDPQAIQVQAHGMPIGYVYRGKGQDMIHDWIKNSDLFSAKLSRVDAQAKEMAYDIAFYKIGSLRKVKELGQGASGKLIRSGSAAAQEAIAAISEGDELSVYYNSDSDRFDVDSTAGNIGSVPKSLLDYAEDAQFFAESIDEDNAGMLSVTLLAIRT